MHVPQHALGWTSGLGYARQVKYDIEYARSRSLTSFLHELHIVDVAVLVMHCVWFAASVALSPLLRTLYARNVLCRLSLFRKTLLRPIICLYIWNVIYWFLACDSHSPLCWPVRNVLTRLISIDGINVF
jgi:hypothetical protein